ncbi:uncharacterized protein LACBIDRAFT_314526 [Laccaria bicolor S238N-H82]|uniref:Predicted protein n=1 Tax=Laccaria bicolor (strain S238N-H82 / ATCC MYA-4686) TaxID=486041 RepID=B0DYR3_LACBS|nr:uncharacterized protein LACBIDRAFT_314526 [Laccaria bicolor S238N-H82]EDR00335.1 predicted protein [Laccaria bicolor S238N-H82]|eukprot:XP_001889087.1 predicted protein [Laccaria bicolor S238N-H82]
MRSLLIIFTLLIGSLLTSALEPRAPTPSNTCVYKCPPKDKNNKALGLRDESSDPLYCQYNTVVNYCSYSKTTGALTADHDSGNCPNKAVCSTSSRRRDALPQSPRMRGSARQVDAAPLKTRSQLGSAKRGKRSV